MSSVSLPPQRSARTISSRRPGVAENADTWAPLAAEADFYGSYGWCLNPCPTVARAIAHLGGELDHLVAVQEEWQLREVLSNVFLLSCTVLGSAEDYLRGSDYRLPRRAALLPFSRAGLWAVQKLMALRRRRRVRQVRRWCAGWQTGLDTFLPLFLAAEAPGRDALERCARALRTLLTVPLPADLLAEPTQISSAFRKQDLTPFDVLALGRKFMARFPDRQQPILVTGLRTAGSYFAPLLRALLRREGYRTVESVTVRPNKGPSGAEQAVLARCAGAGYLALLVDDPPGSGDTFVLAIELLHRTGFCRDRIAVLYPTHPCRRDWKRQAQSIVLADLTVLTLEPEEWHKHMLLQPKNVEVRLRDYFQQQGYSGVRVVAGETVDRLNAALEDTAEETKRFRLKRVYEIQLERNDGRVETRTILAKSVGWGWVSYHAFLAGQRLARYVPPMLGLRDGLLYSEWLPQSARHEPARADRVAWIEAQASYVAARTQYLRLEEVSERFLRHPQHEGFALLSKVLSKAYGGVVAAGLMRPRVLLRLANQACPVPTFIDGRMRCSEWIEGPQGLLKTDFEHHGMGKNELNVCDPAYDLAEAVFHLALSTEEEASLLRHYAEQSGDTSVQERLFLYKVLAGAWGMTEAIKSLVYQPQLAHRQQEFHDRFVKSWHFLTVQAARFCGRLARPQAPRWRSSLIVLDVDGVIDRRVFGFPCTSAAGIQALALLHAHEQSIALDTARSALEVQEYCRAYGLAGGVAEYGSYVWDAVEQRGRALVSSESFAQLERARQALRKVPGVFVDERYRHSVRAFIYEEEGPLPVPTLTVQQVMAAEKLDRLRSFQTTIDTTIVAGEVDKGTGLAALREWVGRPDMETLAVGDTEPDLPMFRQATRSFAPAHIGCARLARALGCRIARHPYQRGLLHIVRSLLHADGRSCERCASCWRPGPAGTDLFVDLLQAADQSRSAHLFRALLHPLALRVFVR